MNTPNTDRFKHTWMQAGKSGLPKVTADEPTYWEKYHQRNWQSVEKQNTEPKYVRELYGK